MSKIMATSSAQIAPAFPGKGYLPATAAEVLQQRRAQQAEISDACMAARAQGQPAPCAQVLNISLYFDGTNNHEESDTANDPRSSSNIARLFHATIQGRDANPAGYYTYYVQGVGTQFVEIGESKPDPGGLKFATGGERRILWGMTRLLVALRSSLGMSALNAEQALALVKQMEYTETKVRQQGHEVVQVRKALRADRVKAMNSALVPIIERMKSYTPKVLRIKLFVYGFSRGAAEARAFVGRLAEVCGDGLLAQIPISIEFLGLFDTVASVGVAAISGGAEGHMEWADDSMALPNDTRLLKRCAHLVSAHEQRLCFPLDSVRKDDGSYPPSVIGEWVYPGVHSDVGGGYPPNDQGKALKIQGLLISQLALHHMYRLAFDAGAPLRIMTKILPVIQLEDWRKMDPVHQDEFDLELILLKRFTAWRKLAGNDGSIENLLQRQTEQITAWRLIRYSGGIEGADGKIKPNGKSQANTDYYRNAKDDPKWQIEQQEAAWKQQNKQGKSTPIKLKNPENPNESTSYQPNLAKTYEPLRDQTQLRDAAEDFTKTYQTNLTKETFTGGVTSFFLGFTRPFSDDCGQEYGMLKLAGEKAYQELIKPENGDVVALYDDHIHDSRAWFMYSTFASREPGGSYFRFRTIFFGDGNTNKEFICKAPAENGHVIARPRSEFVR